MGLLADRLELSMGLCQLKETSADVREQTADPASLIIASVVSSIQTSTAPPQGNIFYEIIADEPIFPIL